MGDAGGHLAEHRQLAGLDQFLLGCAQIPFGSPPLLDLPQKLGVGAAQIGGAGFDPALE